MRRPTYLTAPTPAMETALERLRKDFAANGYHTFLPYDHRCDHERFTVLALDPLLELLLRATLQDMGAQFEETDLDPTGGSIARHVNRDGAHFYVTMPVHSQYVLRDYLGSVTPVIIEPGPRGTAEVHLWFVAAWRYRIDGIINSINSACDTNFELVFTHEQPPS